VKTIEIKPLIPSQVSEILALDQLCLGGLWTAEAYLREIDSPNSTLIILQLRDDQFESDEVQII